eukprot:8467723-Pyramimonas_sp.AAC.1
MLYNRLALAGALRSTNCGLSGDVGTRDAPSTLCGDARNLKVEGGHFGESAAVLLDDAVSRVVSGTAALRVVRAEDQLGKEATHEGIAGAVGVHQILLLQLDHGEEGDLALPGHHGSVGTLGEHNGAAALV